MRGSLAALSALAFAACTGERASFGVEALPEGLELAALVVSGRTAGSELEERRGRVFELELPGDIPEDSEILLLGYTRAAAESTGWDRALDRHVWLAEPDDPLLPSPSFAARSHLGVSNPEFTVIEPSVEVSAAWLPTCPSADFDAPYFVHTNCDGALCPVSMNVNACSVRIDLGACSGLPTIAGSMNGRGEVDFDSVHSLGRCHTRGADETEAPPLMSVACDLGSDTRSCRIDAYAEESRSYVEESRRLKLSDSPPRLGTDDKGRPADGYIGGIVFLDEGRRLVAAVHDQYTSALCEPRTPSKLVIIDPESVEIVATATAPDCLRQLVFDPAPDANGFIGVFRDDPSQGMYAERIGRFDREGRLLESFPIVSPRIDPNVHQLGAIGVQVDFDSAYALFSTFEAPGDAGLPGYLARLDLETFAPMWLIPGGAGIRDIAAMHDQDLAYLDATNAAVVVVDWNGQRLYSYDVAIACARKGLDAADFASIYARIPDVLVFGRDRRPAVLLVDQRQTCSVVPFFEWPAMVSHGHLWPDSSLWVVALEEFETSRASLALFDPKGPRFLPGAWDIGQGAVRIIDWDAERRIWVTLNDTAELVRITRKK